MPKILVIKHGALGDFILATGPFRTIREHHPNDHITLLTTKPYEVLARQSGYFDEVVVDEKPKIYELIRLWKLRKWLNSSSFARVYDLQTSDRSSFYFHLFSHRPEWSGIVKGASHRHNTPERTSLHTIERQKQQLSLIGINEVHSPDVSWLFSDVRKFVQGSFALFVCGGSAHRPEKRWREEGYVELANWAMEVMDITPVFIGTESEEEVIRRIIARVPGAKELVGKTNFADIASLARFARFAVGNDTGPMHIIAAAGCRSVVLFSKFSNPDLCAPRGRVEVLQKDSLADLRTGIVIAAAKRLLAS